MDQSQIYSLALSAGLPDGPAKIAAAIAMAESGGNENQITQDSDDDSYGLWQINMLGSLGPSRRFVYRLKSNNDLLIPQTNARVMSAISSQGKNFSAWSTYKGGEYKAFLGNSVSKVSVSAAGGAGTDNSVPNLINGAKAVVSDTTSIVSFLGEAGTVIQKVAGWVTNQENWVRVAFVVVGGAAVLGGLSAIIRSTEAGQATINAGKKAAKTAAVVAAA